MREIKFRAWDRKQKRFVTYGFLGHDGLYYSGEGCEIYGSDKHVEVQMFTGIHDKTGKSVYEGDLFGELGGDRDRPGEYEVHGQVKWDNDLSMFVIELTNGGWMELYEYMIGPERVRAREVIGNIYENPELLQ